MRRNFEAWNSTFPKGNLAKYGNWGGGGAEGGGGTIAHRNFRHWYIKQLYVCHKCDESLIPAPSLTPKQKYIIHIIWVHVTMETTTLNTRLLVFTV